MGINKEIGGKRVMSDLTDEELIATRRLHGLDDDLFKRDKDIEVGEYVRTDLGEIAKVTSVAKETLGETLGIDGYRDIGFCNTEPFVYGNIVKHSKQLIDVIESEDLIIYRLRGLKSQRRGFIRIYNDTRSGKGKLGIDNYSLEQVKIIKILTHQQFEVNCYKVGGKDE